MCQPTLLRAVAILLATLSVTACTRRFYRGLELPPDSVVVIHVGDTSILELDRRYAFTAFGTNRLEVAPGPHRIVVGFDRPATTIGMRDVPAYKGAGKCTLDFVAEGGKQYWLGTNAIGTDWTMRNWDGKWEGWIRDPSVAADGGTIARCDPRPVGEKIPLPPEARQAARKATHPPAPPTAPAVAAPISAAIAPTAPAPPATTPRVPAPPPPSPVSVDTPYHREQWIRMGAWNLRSLGTNAKRDYDAIAAAIDGNFDILTVTEETSVGGGHPGYDRLIAALGTYWAGLATDTPRASAGPSGATHYAVVYHRGRISPCRGWERLQYLADDSRGAHNGGATLSQGEATFPCFEGAVLHMRDGAETRGDDLPVMLRIRTSRDDD